MSLIIRNKFIREELKDENGNILGYLQFNPNDSRIMNKLSKIVNDLSKDLKQLNKFGELPVLSNKKLENVEDFENVANDFEKINEALTIEGNAIDRVIEDLSEVFGKDTIELFTGGTKDIEAILPLIEFVMPYVKNAREKNMSKYLKNNGASDVME